MSPEDAYEWTGGRAVFADRIRRPPGTVVELADGRKLQPGDILFQKCCHIMLCWWFQRAGYTMGKARDRAIEVCLCFGLQVTVLYALFLPRKRSKLGVDDISTGV